jgi:hypothetical protein
MVAVHIAVSLAYGLSPNVARSRIALIRRAVIAYGTTAACIAKREKAEKEASTHRQWEKAVRRHKIVMRDIGS